MPTRTEMLRFIRESNAIEGIVRKPRAAEIAEFERFMRLTLVTVRDLEQFVSVYQPGARLRDQVGIDVQVGTYLPPKGGPQIRQQLVQILSWACASSDRPRDSWHTHLLYEALHAFSDGNGRSGRMVWAWMYRDFTLGFLHRFYYQTLQYSRPLEKAIHDRA